jgi:UDP-N-acetylmuramate dehydrogenase
MMNDLVKEIKKLNIKIDENVNIVKLTTYKAGGVASILAYPSDVEELIDLIKLLRLNNVKYKVIGNGSNLLFSDKEYEGVLINLRNFDRCQFIPNNRIKVGAGFPLIKLSLRCAKRGLTGLEFASGIPGTVGGAVFMNAGAYKSDMGYVTKSVEVLTPNLEIITMTNKEMDFHYRTSFLQKHKDYICLEATFQLRESDKKLLAEIVEDRKKRRLESQPLEYPSAGSVFRNPDNLFAGKLIEDLGYKGYSIGGAKVSEKHANFIINYNKATGEDIKKLIDFIKDEVKKNYDIDLKVEQEFVNWE